MELRIKVKAAYCSEEFIFKQIIRFNDDFQLNASMNPFDHCVNGK